MSDTNIAPAGEQRPGHWVRENCWAVRRRGARAALGGALLAVGLAGGAAAACGAPPSPAPAAGGGWIVYPDNPALRPGAPGAWDAGALGSMSVLKVDGLLHMYYEAWGVRGRDWLDYRTLQIGHATSTDGLHWTKDPAGPVLPKGPRGAWDADGTWDPFVLHEDGVFKMWYGGGIGAHCEWGYATSTDGVHFAKQGRISRLGNVEDDHVVHDRAAGRYYMYYRDRNYTPPDGVRRACATNETDFDFAHAESVRIKGLPDQWMFKFTHVIVEQGRWYMFYADEDRDDCYTGLATSTDGLHWTLRNNRLLLGDDGEVLKLADDVWLMFYGPAGLFDRAGCEIRVAQYRGRLEDLAARGAAVAPAADRPAAAPPARTLRLTGRYLLLPIAQGRQPVVKGEERCRLTVSVAGRAIHDVQIHLARAREEADWWAALDLEGYVGQPAVLQLSTPAGVEGLTLAESADRPRQFLPLYDEPLRPQFHFSQQRGWNNDVNGLVYYDGEWHLFFQYGPVTLYHADNYWGHAVSRDLVHWEELPPALKPTTQAKGQCFSGSAVVDHKNTAGFQTGGQPPLIAVFTDFGAGVGEALAVSQDRGRTFTYYSGNPVLKHPGNDPRVIWYRYGPRDEPLNAAARKLGGHWVLAVYDYKREFDKNIAFYTSTDLKQWTEQSHLPGYAECPEIVRLPVNGDPQDVRWVVFAADARYAVGRFDGRTFTPEHEGKHRVHYGSYFASQTFNDAPDGRCIQMAWARINLPGMPFNQTFTFPHELTLRRTPGGLRLFARPIPEIARLHRRTRTAPGGELTPAAPRTVAVAGELFDVRAEFALGQARTVGLDIGGNRIVYDAAAGKLEGAPLAPQGGRIALQVLVDRPMIEVCGNDGAVYITDSRDKRGPVSAVTAFAIGGPAQLLKLEVHELNSIWKK